MEFTDFIDLCSIVVFHPDYVCRLSACALVHINIEVDVLVLSRGNDPGIEEGLSRSRLDAHYGVRLGVLVLPPNGLSDHDRDRLGFFLTMFDEHKLSIL